MARVLLINPKTNRTVTIGGRVVDAYATHPPIGLAYIAAVLLRHGHEVRIEDVGLTLAPNAEVIALAEAYRPDIVGFTAYALNYNNALQLCRELKQVLPDAKYVMGGPQASFLPKETLNDSPMDAVVLFEGEYTMLELVEHFAHGRGRLEDILGIAYGRGDDFRINPLRPFIDRLDDLPLPARHLLNLLDYPVPGTVITGRGCEANCIFCNANALSGRAARHRDPDLVFAEIKELVETYGLKKLDLIDDTVTCDRAKITRICQLIKEHNLDIVWACESRVDEVDEELLRIMYDGGCRQIHYGVESGNEEVIRRIGKGINLTQVRQAVQAAVKVGMKVVCSFIVGHPRDTRETVMETILFARELRSMGTEKAKVITPFGILTPYPGSKIQIAAERLGLKILHRDWDRYTLDQVVIEHKNLTAEELKRFWSLAMREYDHAPATQVRFAAGDWA